jgi:hypothetical protein
MPFEDSAFGWLGSQNAVEGAAETPAATALPETPAVETETPAVEIPKIEDQATPVVEDALADKPIQVQIVEDLGGEESARQFLPLVRAIQEAAIDPTITPEKLGQNLDDALAKILDKDQYAAVAWRTYDKYGSLMAEQYLSEHPELATQMGFVKASDVPAKPAESVDDEYEPDEPVQTGKPSARELQLEAQLNQLTQTVGQLQQKLGQTDAQRAEQSQQQIKAAAESEMFGTVVNSTFEKLGWEDEDAKRAVKLAFNDFREDPEAVKAYNQGLKYQQTQQAALRVGQMKAKQAFAGHLKNAIEIVGIQRTQRGAAKTPISPARQEIASTEPVVDAKQQSQGAVVNPFAAADLLTAVRQRVAARTAR